MLRAFCSRQRRWLLTMAAFALLWTVELFVVQEITLVYPNPTGQWYALWAEKIRFGLDLLFIFTLSLLFRRRMLTFLLAGSFFVYLGLLTYFEYFQKPLSLTTMLSSINEGYELSGFALDLFPKRAALALAIVLGIKLIALQIAGQAPLSRRVTLALASVCFAGYVTVYGIANYFDPLHYIQTTRGVGRVGEIRGYLGPWFAEWYYLQNSAVLERALERRKINYNRLTPIEAEIPIHKRLVILQAESFDTNILGFKVNGQEVTPFLNRLREQAMFYRVRAMHFNGSADADFAALNGVAGSSHENTYFIEGYPYENTTPQMLAKHGYAVHSFHGNKGDFYSRRRAFEKMGFTSISFREELEENYGLRAVRWGIPDKEVLNVSAQLLRTSSEPTCHFVITLTTHVPYKLLAEHEKEIFPQPQSVVENYINNMRYLDNCLRDYISALGNGVTVMIYADHPTEEGDGAFEPDRVGGRECIPCMIYDSDRDLSQLQKTRGQPIATDGTLTLVDVINYLRAQVARAPQPEAAPAAAPLVGQQPEHAQPEGS